MSIISIDTNYKTKKGQKKGYLTGILYLSPNKTLCPFATKGCKESCLVSAGRGCFPNVIAARLRKTEMFMLEKDIFFSTLIKDIHALIRSAARKRFIPCVRLNGTSDIDFQSIKNNKGKTIFDIFPNVQFYDYTKDYSRISKKANYHLTYSVHEDTTDEQLKKIIARGDNAAVVFRDKKEEYLNFNVVNGDEDDLRFLDKGGVIVGLSAKGKAKKDTSGFVR
jgi:hypothetical protein